ncbi:MAG: helix-hairpin-helix domain-containing protein [Planctomycetes bacterium]|nr:helix-hairpin-helix domain-containing protein [Planctomycetota bacterium]
MRGAVERPGLHVRMAEGLLLAGVLVAAGFRLLAPGDPEPAPPAAGVLCRVDLNRAPWFELACLPGLGPTRAKEIVRDREERGPFATPEDLDRVPGIGPATVAAVRDWLTVERAGGE